MSKKVKSKKVKGKRELEYVITYHFFSKSLCLSVFICAFLLFSITQTFSQKVAIITPEKNSQTEAFTEKFADSASKRFNLVDLSLSETILKIKEFKTPFNLTIQDSKNLGVSIGCNFFIMIKTDSLRRSDFTRKEYYESFATFYLISSRTGRLVFWTHQTFEEDTSNFAKSKLFSSIDNFADKIADQIKAFNINELNEEIANIKGIPEADSPESKGLSPPLPYNRLKPKYTALASLYNVIATVDILVDVDSDGKILRTEIVRWAGFGLDESVIETVKTMNWRPASRDGNNLPLRILLRYNFRNIETDQ